MIERLAGVVVSAEVDASRARVPPVLSLRRNTKRFGTLTCDLPTDHGMITCKLWCTRASSDRVGFAHWAGQLVQCLQLVFGGEAGQRHLYTGTQPVKRTFAFSLCYLMGIMVRRCVCSAPVCVVTVQGTLSRHDVRGGPRQHVQPQQFSHNNAPTAVPPHQFNLTQAQDNMQDRQARSGFTALTRC